MPDMPRRARSIGIATTMKRWVGRAVPGLACLGRRRTPGCTRTRYDACMIRVPATDRYRVSSRLRNPKRLRWLVLGSLAIGGWMLHRAPAAGAAQDAADN